MRNVWIPGWVVLALYACLALLGAAMVSRRGKWLGAFVGVMMLLGVYRTVMVMDKQMQRSTVVYSVNKACLIDFFEGDQAVSLSDTLTKKQEAFAAQANRTASGVRKKASVLISDS